MLFLCGSRIRKTRYIPCRAIMEEERNFDESRFLANKIAINRNKIAIVNCFVVGKFLYQSKKKKGVEDGRSDVKEKSE